MAYESSLDVNFQIAAFDPKAPWQVGAARKSGTNAIVPDEVLWRFGLAAFREISGRARDDERQFVGNAHRDHVAFDSFADTDAGIETLSDDVGQRFVEGQVQRNFGILREKPRNSRTEKNIGRRRRCEAQLADRLAAEFIRRLQRRLVLVKYRAKPLEQTLAGRGWRNRPRRALDQPHAEAFLEFTNHFAYPRRR